MMQAGDILKSVHDVWGEGGPYELCQLFWYSPEVATGQAFLHGREGDDTKYLVKELINCLPGAPTEAREYFEKQQSELFEAFSQASGESFVCPPLHFFHNEKPSRYIQVFQWLEGKNLDDLLKLEDLSFVDRRMLANMVAHGLAGIHERGFAIVDLKPENILVQIIDDGKHKKYIGSIIDITSAWKCGYGSEPQGTLPHWMVFTEEWRSPEIFFGQRALDTGKIDRADQLGPYYPDTASDVYIAGLIFYQLLTGGLPLDAKTPKEQRALVARIWNGEGTIAHPCDAGAVGISRDQGDLILRMLAKKKEDRPTMREVREALAGVEKCPMSDENDLSYHSAIFPKIEGIIDPNQQGVIDLDDWEEPTFAIDIVFALDATGGMQPFIGAVKNYIRKFLEGIYQRFQGSQRVLKKLRAKVIEYREMVKGNKLYMVDHPFCELYTSDSDQFITDPFCQILGGIKARGGADKPGRTFDAICRAFESDWNEDADRVRKVVVAITNNSSRPLHESTKHAYEEGLSDTDIILDRMNEAMAYGEMRLILVSPANPGYDKILNNKYVYHQEWNKGYGNTCMVETNMMQSIIMCAVHFGHE